MIGRLFILTILGLATMSCQNIPISDIAETGIHKEITGEDGAPMMLVPAGEFFMGYDMGCCDDGTAGEKPVHRVYLDAFYMDKYELTTKRYAVFMQATSRTAPDNWDIVNLGRDGDRPVIGVDWHDADAYCRQYRKRLPTEQEWEKAARGTDGRKYPWGNEEPTPSVASYDWDGNRDWQGYSTLALVGSYKAGKSPYGIYNLAGNVWEWTSSDNGPHKVLRGGSWGDQPQDIRSSFRFWMPTMRRSYNSHYYFGFRCAQDAPK
jgi:formylglycine-generating enzyme required for sulfatase activity